MKPYLKYLQYILSKGVKKADRTGTGTLSVFGYQMRFQLHEGFPLLTTKKLHTRSIFYELLWFLQGKTNIDYLNQHGISIWDEWADDTGELGPIYGKQWRAWSSRTRGQSIDQLQQLIEQIKATPDSRRLIISAWNVDDLPEMALPPCHVLCQFYVSQKRLSCQLYQRSADSFLGVPFNIASYALLTHMIAAQCGLEAGEFVWTGGDCHIYLNHIQFVQMQLKRCPYSLPTLFLKRVPTTLFDYQYEDIVLLNYQAHAAIKAPVAV